MALRTFGLVIISVISIGCANAQPIFPDGVAAISGSMSERQKTIAAATGDDSDKVKELVRGATAALKSDLVDEAALRDLQQARQIPQRVIAARCASRIPVPIRGRRLWLKHICVSLNTCTREDAHVT